jgi:nicotinamidase-related amidase
MSQDIRGGAAPHGPVIVGVMELEPHATVLVAVDMHRGHLDPSVATLPLPAERSRALIERSAPIFAALRASGIPVVHVVTIYRTPRESESNPFWGGKRSATRARSHEHNLAGSPGTQIVPELYAPTDVVVATKKRYSAYLHTDLEFVLRDLGAKTVLLAGVNTNSCVLCTSFETVNRDFDLVVLRDCVDSMDGEEAHRMALTLIETCLGRVLAWDEIREALRLPAPA